MAEVAVVTLFDDFVAAGAAANAVSLLQIPAERKKKIYSLPSLCQAVMVHRIPIADTSIIFH